MAIQYRGYKYSFQLFKNSPGGSTQVPASSISFALFKQGARISGTITGSAGAQTIPVYDPGSIQIGDTICIDTATGTIAVVGSITATTIVTSSGSLLASSGTRVVVVIPMASAITAYSDDQLSQAVSPVQTNSSGAVEFYCREPVIDCYISGTGVTTQILGDQVGLGVWPTIAYFGIKADNSSSDTQALKGAIGRAIALGKQEIELPAGTMRIDAKLVLTGASGLKLKGKGRGLTKIVQTNDSLVLFELGSGTTDVAFEDMDIAGSGGVRTVELIDEINANVSGTSVRRCRFIDGGIAMDLIGSDHTIDDVLFSGTRWGTVLSINAAQRTLVSGFRGRLGAAATQIIGIQGACAGVQLDRMDLGSSSGSTTGISITGTTAIDTKISNSRVSGGTGAAAIVINGGKSTTLTGITSVDSLHGFQLIAGTNTLFTGCQALRSQNNGWNIGGTASNTSVNGCKSSDANQAAASHSHMLIDGAVSSVNVWDFEVGEFAGGTGTNALNGVEIGAGAGTGILVGNVYGSRTALSGQFIANNKANSVNEIYVEGHGVGSASGSNTPRHAGFTFSKRFFNADETTPNVDGANYVTLSYGAGISITNFAGGDDGQLIIVHNVGSNAITLVHAATLIKCPGAANYSLAAGKTIYLMKTSNASLPWEMLMAGATAVTGG